ncbi:MAG: GTPase ObgE [Parachlamydiales bacterium]|jgi:GTP-binding protein
MFIDNLELILEAGKGGNGVVAWRREKYIPKGGPAGGNGGQGGSILIEANRHLLSLEDLRNYKILKAENGEQGGSNNKTGKNGKNLTIQVPLGTQATDENGFLICDLTQDKERFLICQGGRGGKGNTCFKSSTHQAPNICTQGQKGETKRIRLELKLIADIGLIGMPNAGKSTLLGALTAVKVKIAPYPFTTLKPNLGLIEFADYSRLLIADVPGIIKGAAQNRGLGLTFLQHIERTSCLLFVIDLASSEQDPFEAFQMLQEEIHQYNPKIAEKPFLVALNKTDASEAAGNLENFKAKYPFDPQTLFPISALQKSGLTPLMAALQTSFRSVQKTTSV